MEMRQDCACEHDQGYCLRSLHRYPHLQVKQSKDKCQNWARDTSTQYTPQARSSYYGTCYPRQTSEKSSVQRQRTSSQRKRQEKSVQDYYPTCSSRPVKPKEPQRIYTIRGCCDCNEVDCSCTCCLQPPPKADVQAQTSEYFLREKSSQTPQKSKCCRCCRCCRNRGKNNCLNCLDSINVSVEDSMNVRNKNEYVMRRTSRIVPEKDSTLMTRTHSAQCSICEETTPPSKICDFVEGLFGKKYQVGDFRTPCPKEFVGAGGNWAWKLGVLGGGVKAFETQFMKQIERLEEKINALTCKGNSGCDPGPEKEAPDNDVRLIYESKNLNQEKPKRRIFLDHCDLSFPPCGEGLKEGSEIVPCFASSVSDSHEFGKL